MSFTGLCQLFKAAGHELLLLLLDPVMMELLASAVKNPYNESLLVKISQQKLAVFWVGVLFTVIHETVLASTVSGISHGVLSSELRGWRIIMRCKFENRIETSDTVTRRVLLLGRITGERDSVDVAFKILICTVAHVSENLS